MSLVIDPLSVATMGFQESGIIPPGPAGPKIAVPRDELRVATNGWIIVDFAVIPDVNQPTDVRIESSVTDAEFDDHFTNMLIMDHLTTFECDLGLTDARTLDGGTIADVTPSTTNAKLSKADTVVQSEGTGTSAAAQKPATQADGDGSTTASVTGSPTDAETDDC